MLGTDHEPGIYVRTLNDLFRAIEETSNDMEYEVSMSYLEVSPTQAWIRGAQDGAGPCLEPVTRQLPGTVFIMAALPHPYLTKTELREVRPLDPRHTVSEGASIQTQGPVA